MGQRLTFNKRYFAMATALFVVEVLIALLVKDKFVRPYVGDVLVVILMYCFIKSFLSIPPFTVAAFVLAFAFSVESLQYINIIEKIGLHNSPVARAVVGTCFEWIDLLAYIVGVGIVLFIERQLAKKQLTLQ